MSAVGSMRWKVKGTGRAVIAARPLRRSEEIETIPAVFGLRGLSGRNDGDGGDLWIVLFWLRDQFDGDRCATRQRAEIQGDRTIGAGSDGLPIDLDRKGGCWLWVQIEHCSHLANQALSDIGKVVVHDVTP